LPDTSKSNCQSENMSIQVAHIRQGGQRAQVKGTFKVSSDGFTWRAKDGSGVQSVEADEIEKITWMELPNSTYRLLVELKDGTSSKFDGFSQANNVQITEVIKAELDHQVESKQMSAKGWNWGDIDWAGNAMTFSVDGKPAFDLWMNDVSAVNALQTKGEVAIEVGGVEGGEEMNSGDSLFQVRLFCNKPDQKEAGIAALKLVETIKEKADVGKTGKLYTEIADVMVQVPRSRCTVEFYDKMVRFVGKSEEYKVPYERVRRMFRFPKPQDEEFRSLFIIAVDPPLRKGQTVYPHIVIQVDDTETMKLNFDMTKEEIKERFGEKNQLDTEIESTEAKLLSVLMKEFTGKKTIGVGSFESFIGSSYIKCTMKASEGHLFLLEKSLFFIKPTLHVKYGDISEIEFKRVGMDKGMASQTFDIIIHTATDKYEFKSIPRDEYKSVHDFLKEKKRVDKLNLKFQGAKDPDKVAAELAGGSSRSAEPDPYLNELDGEDEDEEEDEDYEGGEGDGDGDDSDADSDDDYEGEGDEDRQAKKQRKE